MLALCYRWHHVATALRHCPGFHTFSGPFVEASATEPLFASAEGASPHRQGHRLLRQAEGDEVSPIYEMLIETPAGAGSVVMSEWRVARDGELITALSCSTPPPSATSFRPVNSSAVDRAPGSIGDGLGSGCAMGPFHRILL
jgi:hypothetical protein